MVLYFLAIAEDPLPEAIMADIDEVHGDLSGGQSLERLDSHASHVSRRGRADSLSVVTVDTADLDCQFTRPDQEQADKMIEQEKSQTGRVRFCLLHDCTILQIFLLTHG